jgi:hypothetical protein
MSNPRRRFPARFDPEAWDEDSARASRHAQAIASAARSRYEQTGVPVEELHQVQEEGPEGTILPQCVKVYLPPREGRFGMVFEVVLAGNQLRRNTSHSGYVTIHATRTPLPSTSSPTGA